MSLGKKVMDAARIVGIKLDMYLTSKDSNKSFYIPEQTHTLKTDINTQNAKYISSQFHRLGHQEDCRLNDALTKYSDYKDEMIKYEATNHPKALEKLYNIQTSIEKIIKTDGISMINPNSKNGESLGNIIEFRNYMNSDDASDMPTITNQSEEVFFCEASKALRRLNELGIKDDDLLENIFTGFLTGDYDTSKLAISNGIPNYEENMIELNIYVEPDVNSPLYESAQLYLKPSNNHSKDSEDRYVPPSDEEPEEPEDSRIPPLDNLISGIDFKNKTYNK